jgi:hypothetical protein
MTSSDIFIISPLLCKNLTIQTSEKILSSNLYNFLTTSIQSNDIKLQVDDKIFYYYIYESSIYEIYIINTSKNNIQTQANIYKYHYEKIENSIDLFISNDYFSIYKNSKLYFFKENKNYEIEDIKSFIKYKYKLNINNIFIVNKNQYKKYQDIFLEKNKDTITFIKPKQSTFYLYYIFYLVILVLLLLIYEYKVKNKKQTEITKERVYKKNTDILYDIVKLSNIYNLKIEKLNFDSKYHLQISSNNKKDIDRFLEFYEEKIKIKYIFKDKKTYILEFDVAQ